MGRDDQQSGQREVFQAWGIACYSPRGSRATWSMRLRSRSPGGIGEAKTDATAKSAQCAILEHDGRPTAYALYRMNGAFERGIQSGAVAVIEAIGDLPQATAAIWRYLFDIDWMARVRAWLLPLDHPLLLLLAELSRLGFSLALDGKPAVLRIFQRRHRRRPRRIALDRLDGARRVADRGGGDGVDAADILGRLWPHRSVGQPESTRRRRCRSAFTDGHLSKAAAGGRRQRRQDRPFRKQTPNASVRPYVASN